MWRHLAVSLALIWGAALAKEIGITIVSLLTAVSSMPSACSVPVCLAVQVGAVILHLAFVEELTSSRHGLQRLTVQVAVLLATVATYVRLRSWLAGDQLVRIYRKVSMSREIQQLPQRQPCAGQAAAWHSGKQIILCAGSRAAGYHSEQ